MINKVCLAPTRPLPGYQARKELPIATNHRITRLPRRREERKESLLFKE
jgi:hypothetical protein